MRDRAGDLQDELVGGGCGEVGRCEEEPGRGEVRVGVCLREERIHLQVRDFGLVQEGKFEVAALKFRLEGQDFWVSVRFLALGQEHRGIFLALSHLTDQLA